MQSKINKHNKSILLQRNHETNNNQQACNCREPSSCPLDGQCLTTVIYQATVETSKSSETYVALTQNNFKTRYRNHVASFKNDKLKNTTELSKHIWSLKESNIKYKLSWKILARARPYSNVNKRCNLCITEKYFIICKPEMSTLNNRNDLSNTYRHANGYLLKNMAL